MEAYQERWTDRHREADRRRGRQIGRQDREPEKERGPKIAVRNREREMETD